MKRVNFLVFIFVFLVTASCFNAQPNKDKLPGIEVTPGASVIDTSFFKPFRTRGKILEKKSDGESSIFRLMEMEMEFAELDDKKVIVQELKYLDEKNNPTGLHKTFYDPETFQVLFWEYKGFNNKMHFAFKASGTSLSGTMNPSAKDAEWQKADIGVKLFQNETREILFRSLNIEKGKSVKFPVIGMQPPFHGWVAYEYNCDEEIEFNGKKYTAKVWQTPNSKNGAYYKVISDPPYVIERGILGSPKGSHTFKFESVEAKNSSAESTPKNRHSPGDKSFDASVFVPFEAEYSYGLAKAKVTLHKIKHNGEDAFDNKIIVKMFGQKYVDQAIFSSKTLAPLKQVTPYGKNRLLTLDYLGKTAKGKFTFTDGKPSSGVEAKFENEVFVGTQANLLLAALKLKENYSGELPIAVGFSKGGSVMWNKFKVEGKETLKINDENFDVWRIDNGVYGKVWLTNKAPFVIKWVQKNGTTVNLLNYKLVNE